MTDIDPIFRTAHKQAHDNRAALENGGTYACFQCFKTFDANEIMRWIGVNNTTALCPFCRSNAVLSSKLGQYDQAFLSTMHEMFCEHWINIPDNVD